MIEFNSNNETKIEPPKIVIVGVNIKGNKVKSTMMELEALCEAAGGSVIGYLEQNIDKPNSKTYIGQGKLEELKNALETLEGDMVVFNHELTGIQLRNLEDYLDVRVIDRTILVLDIFANRAKTIEGQLQVELAQLNYRKSRLLGFGKSLSRQGGGIGTRGPGEKKLEVDRRHIQGRIEEIKKELKNLENSRKVQRAMREKNNVPIVALAGYTNVGKSAIMNKILDYIRVKEDEEKRVFSEDMLFATLDTHSRAVDLDSKNRFILVDTVGFVSNLPHSLVEAFKATLEEVCFADLVLHIVDASSSDMEFEGEVALDVLKDIGVNQEIIYNVYNKVDKIDKNVKFDNGCRLSALTGEGIEELLEFIKNKVFDKGIFVKLIIPYTRGDLVSLVCKNGEKIVMDYKSEGTYIEAEIQSREYNILKEYIIENTL